VRSCYRLIVWQESHYVCVLGVLTLKGMESRYRRSWFWREFAMASN
jgi:hypothetical protein